MTDFLIDTTQGGWDLALDDGDLVLTHTISRAQEIAQRVVYVLMTWLGESPYERTAGQPYLDGIFGEGNPVPGVVAMILQSVIEVDGVDEIIGEPDFELTPENRVLAIALTIRAAGEDVDLSLSVTP